MVEENSEVICDIETTMNDLLSIPRFLGTFPFNRNHEFVPLRLSFVFMTTIAHSYIVYKKLSWTPNLIKKTSYVLSIAIMNLPPFIHVVWLYIKNYRLKEFYLKLILIGKYFRSVGIEWDICFKWIYKYLSLVLIVIFFTIFVYMKMEFPYGFTIDLTWVYVAIYSLYDQISSFCVVLSYSFSRLKYITDNRQLLKKKEILASLCKLIEELFSLQFLYILFVSFIDIVYVLFTIFKGGFGHTLIMCWLSFILSIYPLIRMIIMLNNVIIQAKKIDKLLYRRLLANPDDKMLEFHMIAKRDVTFTAFGFFHINSTLIGSMIGAGTTYLVILLQYAQ
ncbi:Gustatory receptor 109b [Halyomorpha halys]|nr:Gustatory receptor 109b [Halyomorpha halys]